MALYSFPSLLFLLPLSLLVSPLLKPLTFYAAAALALYLFLGTGAPHDPPFIYFQF